jgi:uncharacterized delta-60 repeat protein
MKNNKLLHVKFLQFLFILLPSLVFSQAGLNDPTFNLEDHGFGFGLGCNTTSYASAVQADGKIIIGGAFTKYNDKTCNRIVRVLPDGQRDETFNPYNPFMGSYGFNDNVYQIIVQPDQKIIVTGVFSTYQGVNRNGIIRLNTNGSVDNTFNPGTAVNGLIRGIVLQPDGKMVIVGTFTSYNGTAVGRIARINPNGTIDNTFNNGTGFSTEVSGIALQSDGKILVAGSSNFNGVNVTNLNRILPNGGLDPTFNGSLSGVSPSKIAVQSDGKILLNNILSFSTINVRRLNSDGSVDNSFVDNLPTGDVISSLTLQTDGKIIVTGGLTISPFSSDVCLARLNSNGTVDPTFNLSLQSPDWASEPCIQLDGKIIVCGFYEYYQDYLKSNICRIQTDGNLDHTFNPMTGTSGPVYDIVVSNNDYIWIGGNFDFCDNIPIGGVARLKPNGDIDTSFHPSPGTFGLVYALAEQPDGKLLVGGWYTSFNGVATDCVVRLMPDGSLDPNFLIRNGIGNQYIKSIVVQPDGKILVGGGFYQNSAYQSNRITRLNPDGTTDATFVVNLGFNGIVTDIKLLSNGQIMVAGDFTNYAGSIANRIVRLNSNGSIDATFNPGSGPSSVVADMEIQPDGKIILGGSFTTYNGTNKNKIARIFANGTLDAGFTAISGANGDVNDVEVDANGKVIVTGVFNSFNSVLINKIIRLNSNGTTDATFNVGTGTDFIPFTIAFQSTERILIGGEFKQYNNIGRNYMARIFPCAVTQASETITECTSFLWNGTGQEYLQSGTYYTTVSNGVGCDTLKQLNLTILPLNVATSTVHSCSNYSWNQTAQTYTVSGTYGDTVAVAGSCDSIYVLNLTIGAPNTGTNIVSTCGSYTWIDGITYNSSTTLPTYLLTNQSGCDSLVSLQLTIFPNVNSTETIETCDSFTWSTNGQTYNNSGQYQMTLQTINGCDSLVLLDLTVHMSSQTSETINTCDQYIWPVNNMTYTSSGTYQETYTSQFGCDSIVSLDLTINNSEAETINLNGLDSVEVNGTFYDQDGTYFQYLTSSAGCDSTLTIIVNLDYTGLSEMESSFRIYPNPAHDFIRLEALGMTQQEYSIVDFQGRSVRSGIIGSTNMVVGIGDLQDGIYYIEVPSLGIRTRFMKIHLY